MTVVAEQDTLRVWQIYFFRGFHRHDQVATMGDPSRIFH